MTKLIILKSVLINNNNNKKLPSHFKIVVLKWPKVFLKRFIGNSPCTPCRLTFEFWSIIVRPDYCLQMVRECVSPICMICIKTTKCYPNSWKISQGKKKLTIIQGQKFFLPPWRDPLTR